MSQLIITAVGPDRPGLVGEITGHLYSAGGNILDSRMVNLRGQFAMLILVDCPDATARDLAGKLPDAGRKIGLTLTIVPQTQPRPAIAGIRFKLKTYSMDQPGIVHRIGEALRKHGVNVEDLSARQESAAFAGSNLFVMEMKLTVPPTVPVKKLREDLAALCDQINCDFDLEPA